ncbi:MAG: isocitrate dehydrogenase [Alphaproteobacteria bacterium RIFCSPLOWO2_01_FULL_40_26]|nr:MAG: isocitrate dehydrogenase [Alphaproteobacteria bacterium RIFCSPHIGHO2_02_FULL_40_34]OFW86048.1 MAG: isocitrate dehydrogenase [Alphaproteobacteria bacterium RIFCSPHIGHO2_01_FULL_40_8]OFW95192.1 MAG: isocitrate dehydrogenase [Alphaproteobacteria bacterium RIFCSPLOWO2_01_FULL_40_26]OFX09973.1 MAG: isocitrate dehydrogenase [Alphaproteobacteria bacterium RIFCSPLOWO2_02_FULL_40_19]OFX12333.1 MAG: isocitrate dehydrogenase [Alphaproteobacteria bacterium RIFCSPLOWO2_12_FULL_40_11]
MTKTITIAYGDGIGPEIMNSALEILCAAKANLQFDVIEVGENIYEKGFTSGLMPSAWESLNNTRILLKAPITTPQGGGYKSLNVTLRKKLGLFANIRPVSSFYPFIATKFPQMDVVIIRENEEDLYAGIEYRQTDQTYQCLKLVTREGCEKIIRFAFEHALANSRKKISCFSKDNIMKMTDGLFHKTFDEIAKEYPEIKTDHYIVDIGAARLAARPEIFDVIVTMNLYGDIISDIAAEISGSVGLAGSANIGTDYAMFEAIHGSAPDIAGQNIANPCGLIQASVMMLNHIGQNETAAKIRNAIYKTIEDGMHTTDIYNEQTSKKKLGTKEFTAAVIARLGQKPEKLPELVNSKKSSINNGQIPEARSTLKQVQHRLHEAQKSLTGFDLFIDWQKEFDDLLALLKTFENEKLAIKTISAKGLILWPLIDKHMMPNYAKGLTMLRFIGKNDQPITHQDIIDMLSYLNEKNIDFVKYEGLYSFDGQPSYSSGQGE